MRPFLLFLTLLAPGPVLSDPALVDAELPPRYDDVLGSAATIETFRMTGVERFDPDGQRPEPPDRIVGYGAAEQGRDLGDRDRERLLSILRDRTRFRTEKTACIFDPTVGYRVVGSGDVIEIVICHGCNELTGTLGDERFFLGLRDDADLLAIAARVFPHDPRLIEYRRKELLHAVRLSQVEEIDAFAVIDANDGQSTLDGFSGRAAGPPVRLTPEQHDRLMVLLARTSSFALEPKECMFEPTVGYRILTRSGPVTILVCHDCDTLRIDGDGKTGTIEIDPARAEFLALALELVPDAPGLRGRR